jgi:hypothetical protein
MPKLLVLVFLQVKLKKNANFNVLQVKLKKNARTNSSGILYVKIHRYYTNQNS